MGMLLPILRCRKFIIMVCSTCLTAQRLTKKGITDLESIYRISQDDLRIRVLLPAGLVRIQDDSSWVKALYTISEAEWMDNEMKILIEV